MASADTIPITISEEAAARITKLGLQREFEEIVDYLRQGLPGLRRIDVDLEYDRDEPGPPTVLLDAFRPFFGLEEESVIHDRWTRWLIGKFPPAVFVHFVMLPTFEEAHEG